MAKEQEKSAESKDRKVLRPFLRFFLFPVGLVLAVAVGVLVFYCVFKPELVAQIVQNQLSDSTKLPWRINGSIYPSLTPSPGIRATDVLILAASEEQGQFCNLERPLVQAREVHISLDTSTLFSLNPRIKLIRLESPGIYLTYDEMHRPLWLPLSSDEDVADDGTGGADPPPGSSVPEQQKSSPADTSRPEDFQVASGLSGQSGPGAADSAPAAALPPPTPELPSAASAEYLKTLAGMLLAFPDGAFPPMRISDGYFSSYTVNGEMLLSFTNIEAEINPNLPARNLVATADFALPDADMKAGFSLEVTLGREGIPARGSVSGAVAMTPPGSRTVNGSFASNFSLDANGKDLVFPDFRFVAEGDGLTASLRADLAEFSCTGQVQLHKLSLPRWFGFGRSLPPGLQQPMDGLIGEFDLFLDADGAEAWNLRGAVGPLAVSGYVGVKDFSAPEVVVDLDLDRANLDLIFPFLAKAGKYVPDPRAPEFDHPVLAPYPSAPQEPGEPDRPGTEVSYDVKVRVARPRVHDVEAGPLEVLVFPVRTDGEQKTRVSFDSIAVLKGLVSGKLDIDEQAITMRYDVSNAELGLLPENQDNNTRIAGKVNGYCIIAMPFDADGEIVDDWPITVNAGIGNCDITGRHSGGKWQLFSGTAKASGKGSIYTVLSKGIRIDGLWDVSAQNIKSSWNPKGRDAVSGQFNGALVWPPIERKTRRSRREILTVERIGMDKLVGRLSLSGSFAAPLGDLIVPVKGQVNSRLTWQVTSNKISLEDLKFEGFGSYGEGRMDIDFSKKDVLLTTSFSSKMNPRILLKEWDLLPPSFISMPKVVTGKAGIRSEKGGLRFENIRLEADGAPITGEIFWNETAPESQKAEKQRGQWNFRLKAEHLNLDNFFPPPAKNQPVTAAAPEPWDLKSFKNTALDIQLDLRKAKYRQLTFSNTRVTATLQRDRFSVHGEIGNFYDGTATLLFQGTVVPSASQVSMRKGLLQMRKISLGKALYDYTREQFYAGSADVVVDIAGNLTSAADFPGKLSGIWSINITDGMYPAFMSNEKSNLRNTFSQASASGPVTRGVISSKNFRLSGPLVDMSGSGTLNLATSEIDLGVSVTFAKVPTVPVRFTGTMDKPKMQVQGASVVVETVQAAGVGVFSLLKNVLELPAHAVRGINSLVTKENK